MTRRIWIALAVVALVAFACGGPQTVDLAAVEYEFQGVPETLEAGEVTFVLENEGQEDHEIGMVRIAGDIAVEELLRLPEDESEQHIAEDMGHTFAKPGQSAQFTANLVPGRYGFACFVEAPDGEPHAIKGMFGEFTIE